MRFPAGTIGYLLAYAFPALVIGAVQLGTVTGHPDLFAFAPIVVVYLLIPIYQENWPRQSPEFAASVRESRNWRRWYRILPLLSPVPQLAMIYVAAEAWSSGGLSGWGRAGLVLATGSFSTFFGVNIAHTLMHRRAALDRAVSGILLSMMCFGTFRIVHLQIHHPHVCTPADFSSAPRGRGFYRYWLGCLAGNMAAPVRLERARLAKAGLPWWQSELVAWSLLSLVWLGGAVALFGPAGGIFFLLQSLLAITQLDLVNYIQHYGLARRRLAGDRYEPVGLRHAWCQSLRLDDLVLLNLPRHADHHVHPQRAFEALDVPPEAPRHPYSYSVMIMLALVPPLFRRVVDPRLDLIGTAAAR